MKSTGTRPYRQARRAASVAATRERILGAAKAALADPTGDLSLESVARRANVGRPTVYRHYRSHDELFRAVVRRLSEEHDIRGALTAALAERNPATSVRRFVEISTGLWTRETALIRGALRLSADPGIDEILRGLEQARRRDAAEIARRVAGPLAPDDLTSALVALTSPETFFYLIDRLTMAPGRARGLLVRLACALVEED